MRPFADRLREAAAYAGIEYSQTAIAKSLGISKQTVDRWFSGGEPRPIMIFHIADRWKVDPRWLATDEGSMFPRYPASALTTQELELLERYRQADPQWKRSLSMLVKGAKRAAMVMVFAVPPFLPTKADAAAICALRHQAAYYVKWLLRWLALPRLVMNP